jgi:hypothetical protein
MSNAYVFRLNTLLQSGQGTLPLTIKDWGNTNAMGYTATEIAQIPPSNPKSTNEPTSIPSPFARLALTKTAFKEVAEKGTSASMAYQQIVSNSLDVAEIFFNFSMLKDHVGFEIIKWSYKANLQNIQSSILKSTLELFFDGDGQSLNLSDNATFYFIRHHDTGKIIGGTSPRTLFFSAANVKRRRGGVVEPEFIKADGTFFVKSEGTDTEQEYGKIELSNNHIAFSDIKPLSKRDIKFQDYLHTWVKVNNTVALNEVAEYLRHQIVAAQTAHFNALPDNLSAYSQVQFVAANGTTIFPEILGNPLYEQQTNPSDIADTSDFVVSSTIFANANPPLILGGTAAGIENWQLDGDTKWGIRTVNPAQDRNTLPGGGLYPWLTADDFLENKIIQLPKPIEKGYFSGNHTNNDNKSVLLPLKDKFFEFFTVEELQRMLKIDGSAAIKVTLEIPVKDGKKVTFSKDYKSADIITLSGETDFLLFPNVKFNDAQSAFYRFGLFREFAEIKKLSAKFYNKSSIVSLNETNDVITRNENDSQNHICTTYALERKDIDRVKILIDGNQGGVIIPKLETKGEIVDFTFAVDFGTTNTHIEFKTNEDGNIKPFDVTDQDEQISWFVNPGDRVCQTRLVADIDFIPEHIGFGKAKNIKVKFPTRTALIVANNATTDHKLPFVHTNIVLPFDKRNVPVYNGVPITQLKWESNVEEVGYYIDNLCYLIRNKVILGNGKLANTKILWSYPLSMKLTRLDNVREKWEEAYKKYFGDNADNNCKNLTESLAPFYHYSSLPDYCEYIKDLVSIDIGGGTTDVVFVKDSKPHFVTSFRFAANDLLGLGRSASKIIAKHKQNIKNQIFEFRILSKTMNSIEQNTESGDFASFFFSLKDNEDLIEKGKSIDFNKMLKEDNNQKLVFLLFFAAIIYHTAQVMKCKGQTMPRHLTFSGNGSRIIDVLGKKYMLEKIATLIFEKIFDAKYGKDRQPKKLEIIPNTSNPKEVTCKGLINTLDKDDKEGAPHEVLLGIDDNTLANSQTYSDLQKKADFIDKINTQVTAFFSYVLDELLKSEIKKQVGTESIEKALSIPRTAIEKAKEVIAGKEDMKNITNRKIGKKIQDAEYDEIEETLFFFPIPALLRTISKEIENEEE